MTIIIIEDETLAAQRLQKLVSEIEPDAIVQATLDTVRGAVEWLTTHPAPDLIFMDIQLADGISFQIFERCTVISPVIFTTAYDEYALRAFKVNSIDYILKPVDTNELRDALQKMKHLTSSPRHQKAQSTLLENIGEAVKQLTRKFKVRFVIKVGEHLRTIETASILYFYSQDKTTFCATQEGRSFILDYTMEQLEEITDPSLFFRVNRKYMVRSEAIQDIITYTNSRLKLVLKGSQDQDIIVARERVQDFRAWLDT